MNKNGKKMNKKCEKYRELFVFGEESTLQEHLQICADCQEEHRKQQVVSMLIKESAPIIQKKETSVKFSKIAASIGIIIISTFFITNTSNIKPEYQNSSTDDVSVVTQMGLPTDDYGLLTVN